MSTTPSASGPRQHSTAAGITGILAVFLILLASVTGTVHATLLSPDSLTAIVAPVGTNPDVQAVLADQAATRVVTALDVEGRVKSVLDGRVGALVAPAIANGVHDRLATAIAGALASPSFAPHWEQLVHASAVVAVNVLKGDSTAITTSDGVIYLNLLPAIGSTIDALKAQGIIDASVQLPDLSNPQTPVQQVIAALGSALGASLPPDFGQVPIAQTTALASAQQAVAFFDAATFILIAAAIALTIAAVVLAADRRAMVVRIGIGAALLIAVVPPLLRFADHVISTSIASPGMSVVTSAFVDAIVDAVSWPLRAVAAGCLAAALVAMIIDALAGATRASFVPLLGGTVAFIVAWMVIGPDAALLALALALAGAWIAGRPLLAPGTSGRPDAPGAAAGP